MTKIKVDFLKMRLNFHNKILEKIKKLVDNSDTIYINSFFYIKFQHEYHTFKKYDLLDTKNNLLGVVVITNELNERFDVYDHLELKGLFWNLYDYIQYVGIYEYFNLSDKNVLMRLDLRRDYSDRGVSSINFKLSASKNIRYHKKRSKSTRKNLCLTRYDLKVYNKKLDILDKRLYKISNVFGEYIYQDILTNNSIYTRLELKLKRTKIKEEGILLSQVFDLDYKFNNICAGDLVGFGKKTRHVKEDLVYERTYLQIRNHTNTMYLAYLHKMYEIFGKKEARKKIKLYLEDIDEGFIF